jgi:transposase InsO family protein
MSERQRLIYGARIRLEWFLEAERLGSVTLACQKLGVPRRTYYYWHKRWLANGKTLRSLFDESRTPKSNPNTIDSELAGLIVGLRIEKMYGEDALQRIMLRDYGLVISAHAIHNVLNRAELLEHRKQHKPRKRRLDSYAYQPGEVLQMDVKHWKRSGYQYDIIDCCTRIKYKRIYNCCNVNNTVDFLEKVLRFYAPAFVIQNIQTDNGTEFNNNKLPLPKQTKQYKLALPEIWLREHGIGYRYIPSASPHLNGRIERPHGVDKWRYNRMTTGSHTLTELKAFCLEDCLDYNTYRPHSMLNWMTPLEYLNSLAGYEQATIDTGVLYD